MRMDAARDPRSDTQDSRVGQRKVVGGSGQHSGAPILISCCLEPGTPDPDAGWVDSGDFDEELAEADSLTADDQAVQRSGPASEELSVVLDDPIDVGAPIESDSQIAIERNVWSEAHQDMLHLAPGECEDESYLLYVRDIGKVESLTTSQERTLSILVERGRHLSSVQTRVWKPRATLSVEVGTTVDLIERVVKAQPVLDAVRRHVNIEDGLSMGQVLGSRLLRNAIDQVIGPELVGAVARDMNCDGLKASRAIVDLSMNSGLLPPRALQLLVVEDVASLHASVENDSLSMLLEPHTQELSRHYEMQKRAAELAENHLLQANFRLVTRIAEKYVGLGVPLLDLIQEGNLGLMRAVSRYRHREGVRLASYASFWIRSSIARAIADQARVARIPVHVVEKMSRVLRVADALRQELGREPRVCDIASRLNEEPDRVEEMITLLSGQAIFLGTSDVPDLTGVPSADEGDEGVLEEYVDRVLDELTPREKRVLQLRFGLKDGHARTLEEVGQEFNVTRERIRQIEAKAIRKLQHPSRTRKLRGLLD